MSFSKNRKRSGVILAGVTTASVAASVTSQNVANANIEGNIVTEHESKYMLEGKKIYRVVAYKN